MLPSPSPSMPPNNDSFHHITSLLTHLLRRHSSSKNKYPLYSSRWCSHLTEASHRHRFDVGTATLKGHPPQTLTQDAPCFPPTNPTPKRTKNFCHNVRAERRRNLAPKAEAPEGGYYPPFPSPARCSHWATTTNQTKPNRCKQQTHKPSTEVGAPNSLQCFSPQARWTWGCDAPA
jgi:hypothetical protein